MSGQQAAGQKREKNLKTFNSQQDWERAVNNAMAIICDFRLIDVPASFDTKRRYEHGDDPATTARAAYDAIEG